MSKLDAAIALATKGFKVFPIKPGAKAPPLWKDWPGRASTTVAPSEWPDNANIGVHCDGLIVVDVDPKNGGDKSFQLLELAYGFPPTLVSRTPSGGRHLFFRLPENHGGVPNSVGLLGSGVDVRSTGGYVLGAGSETGAGRYEWLTDAPIAGAPTWLVERLGEQTATPHKNDINLPDAAPDVLARAETWLKTAERSVRGSGGDQAAYRVACRLRDFGASYGQACELMRSEAWDYGCGWRDGWLEDKPIRSAYRYATGEPGSKAAVATDFAEPQPDTAPVARAGKLRTAGDVDATEVRKNNYLIKGWIDRGADCLLFGQWNAGKTFIVLDMLACLTLERTWFGIRTRASRALYLAYEGHAGLDKRVLALTNKYPALKTAPFAWWPMRHPITSDKGRKEVEDARRDFTTRFGGAPDIVVIDPLRNALGGSDSDADLVEKLGAEVRSLMAADGCAVMKVTHSGHGDKTRVRGDSGMVAAADSEILVEAGKDGQAGTIRSTKQRDAVKSELNYSLDIVVLGVDDDHDEVTSCTVSEAAAPTPVKARPRLSGNYKHGFSALCKLAPDNRSVERDAWRDACREFLGTTGAKLSRQFYDIKVALIDKGYVVEGDGFVTRRME